MMAYIWILGWGVTFGWAVSDLLDTGKGKDESKAVSVIFAVVLTGLFWPVVLGILIDDHE